MKLVRQYINEKFDQESDPIANIGIGGVALGVLRHQMKEDFKLQVYNKIKELIVGKTVSGEMNEMYILTIDSKTKQTKGSPGKGWGKYTIKIDSIAENIDILDDPGIPVYCQLSKNKLTAYLIPFGDRKIHIQ